MVSGRYTVSDVVIGNDCLYKFASNTMNQYNMSTEEYKAITVAGLFSVTTMDVDNDKVMITGFSETGQAVSGYLNFSDTSASLVYTDIMKEIRIAALN